MRPGRKCVVQIEEGMTFVHNAKEFCIDFGEPYCTCVVI